MKLLDTTINTANKLTIFRLILIPFFVYFLLNNVYTFALVIFVIAAFTDHLDGKIARKQGKVTDFGKFADPLADKALVMTAFICFVEIKEISVVAVILTIVREFIVMSIRLMSAKKGDVISANIWGKAKTISQFSTIFLVILILATKNFYGTNHYPYEWLSIIVKEIFLWSSVALSCISGAIYVYKNRSYISKN